MAKSDASNTRLIAGAGIAVVVAVAMLFFFRGPSEAHVSGKATFDNAPLTGAQVVFLIEGEAKQAPVLTLTDEAGRYVLIGNSGAGVPVGKYRVVVNKLTLKDGTLPPGEALEQARLDGLLLNCLPKAYEDRSTTPLQFDLQSGANTVNLELKKVP